MPAGMAARRISPPAYRRVTLLALLALAFIIVTGGAVRLTGSGLGCPDWPNCDQGRLVAPLEYHAMIEFVNRTVTGLVSLAVILAVLGSLLRQPRRRDLVVLSLGLVAGVVGQIVLGGLTVLFDLRPPFVMAHFLLSMLILWNAVTLHWRAGEGQGPARALVEPDLRRLGRLIVAATALVIFLGTVVTAAGPHGGDERAERLDVPLHRAAQVHGAAVVVLLALVVAMLALLARTGAPAAVQRRGRIVLAVLLAQAAIGYTQYFTGVPVALVAAHILGAVAVWTAVVRFQLGLVERGAEEEAPAAEPRGVLVST